MLNQGKIVSMLIQICQLKKRYCVMLGLKILETHVFGSTFLFDLCYTKLMTFCVFQIFHFIQSIISQLYNII